MVKCLPEFEYFYYVLENKYIIFKIRRSKVTDYAALTVCSGDIKKKLWKKKLWEKKKKKSSENDQLPGHFQSFFIYFISFSRP